MCLLPRNLFARPVGAAIAVIVAAAFTPGRAAAECGDYVHIVKDGVEQAMPGHPDGGPKKPCDGPGCSNNPGKPAAPISAPVSPTGGAKELAARTAATTADCEQNFGSRLPDDAGLPIHHADPIFHPPRAA